MKERKGTKKKKRETPKVDARRAAGILIIIVVLYIALDRSGVLNSLVPGRLADTGAGYGALFVIGLLTSIHCVAMCGGINLSQAIPKDGANGGGVSAFRPSLLYTLGRVVSYTAIGGVLGLLGMALGGGAEAGLSAAAQGVLKLIAGAFMVVMGVRMLGIFPQLDKLTFRVPKFLGKKNSPLIVGLLNGFMPCGALQSMQIVALASASPSSGALSMLAFSLGTAPLTLGLGSAVSALGNKFARQVMSVGAVLVVALGLAMFTQGGALSGFLTPAAPAVSPVSPAERAGIIMEDGKQVVSGVMSAGAYPSVTVARGVPVKWTLKAPRGVLNGCNSAIVIPEYGLQVRLNAGENVIEFTPEEAGTFGYSCWMGMIRSSITVVDESEL